MDALTSLASVAPAKPARPHNPVAWRAAQDFEAVLLGQLSSMMLQTTPTDENFGGGHGEDLWRGMMAEQLGREMAKSGGIGLATHVYDQMIRMQEARP
jgi:Rod binding domain-containing protein